MPVSEQMIIALLGVGSALITGVIVQIFSKVLDDRREKKRKKTELISVYIGPLYSYLRECKRRTDTLHKNINDLTCDKQIKNVNDILAQDIAWYYEHGHYLASTCYLFSCLFAQFYRIQFKFPNIYMNRKEYNEITAYINRLVDCFTPNLGVYYVIVYDIGKIIYNTQMDDVISFSDFSKILLERKAHGIYRLLNFLINIGDGTRCAVLEDIVAAINDFHDYLGSFA